MVLEVGEFLGDQHDVETLVPGRAGHPIVHYETIGVGLEYR